MKITVLMGSPNRNGSTSILVENFKRGAEKLGILWKSSMSVTQISIPVSAV